MAVKTYLSAGGCMDLVWGRMNAMTSTPGLGANALVSTPLPSATALAYVRSMMSSLRAEVPGKEDRAMSSTLSVKPQQTSSIVHNGT
jgi:hypothetical protein